jgi:hypothetical protein
VTPRLTGLKQFFAPDKVVANIQRLAFDWLFKNDEVKQAVSGLTNLIQDTDLTTEAGIKKVALGVVYQLSNASDLTLDFLKRTIAEVTGFDPDAVLDFLRQLDDYKQIVQDGQVNLQGLRDQLPGLADAVVATVRQQVQAYVANTVVPRLIAQAVAALDISGTTSALLAIYNTADWFTRNAAKLQGLINRTLGLINRAAQMTPDQVSGQLQAALGEGFPPLLDLAASNLGFGGLPDWLTETLRKLDLRTYVRLGVQKLWELVQAAAGRTTPATSRSRSTRSRAGSTRSWGPSRTTRPGASPGPG